MKRVATEAATPETGPMFRPASRGSERPSWRIEAHSTTKSWTAPPRQAPITIHR